MSWFRAPSDRTATDASLKIVPHSGPKADAMPLAMSIERRQQARRRGLAAVSSGRLKPTLVGLYSGETSGSHSGVWAKLG